MATFTKLNLASKIRNQNTNEVVSIFKFQKDGTKSFFFAPEVNEKRITKTMFTRLYGAEDLAKQYLNRN